MWKIAVEVKLRTQIDWIISVVKVYKEPKKHKERRQTQPIELRLPRKNDILRKFNHKRDTEDIQSGVERSKSFVAAATLPRTITQGWDDDRRQRKRTNHRRPAEIIVEQHFIVDVAPDCEERNCTFDIRFAKHIRSHDRCESTNFRLESVPRKVLMRLRASRASSATKSPPLFDFRGSFDREVCLISLFACHSINVLIKLNNFTVSSNHDCRPNIPGALPSHHQGKILFILF